MIQSEKLIVAIDGPAGVGKGTLAKKLAGFLKCPYLETGLLYRAVAFRMMEEGISFKDDFKAIQCAKSLKLDHMASPLLKSEEVGNGASQISIYPELRQALLEYQRNFASHGAVLDGRDIGSIVCPWAQVKIFLTASLETRIERRVKELQKVAQTGINLNDLVESVSIKIIERDKRDRDRTVAPLVPAEDAYILDTSKLNAEQVFNAVVEHINKLGLLPEDHA